MRKTLFFIVCSLSITIYTFVVKVNTANTQTAPSNPTAIIRVCAVITNFDGSVVNGKEQPGSQLRLAWFDPTRAQLSSEYELANVVPPSATFTTPLNLNTKLDGIPAGPPPNGFNAQCKNDYPPITLENSNSAGYYDNIFYQQVPALTGDWQPIKYHDGFTGVQNLSSFGEYDARLYDGNENNDNKSERNLNADGHMLLLPGSNRTLLIYTRYGRQLSALNNCDGNCSSFDAGKRGSNVSSDNIVSESGITINDDNLWIKINVKGRNEGAPQQITLTNVLNDTAYFVLDNPFTTTEIKRKGNNAGDITSNCRSNTAGCNIVVNNNGSINITLPAINSDSSYDIFIKVRPLQATPGEIDINNQSSSSIRYLIDNHVENLGNDKIAVEAVTVAPAYFTVQAGGNIYSASRINSELPTGQGFYESGEGLLLLQQPATFGSGTLNASGANARNVRYSNIKNPTDQLIADISKNAKDLTDPTMNTFLPNGAYVRNGDLRINGTLNAGDPGNQQLVIIVRGDLFVDSPIVIPENGRDGIAFVVEGNVIVRPTVTTLHGIFITKSKFFTACTSTVVGGACTNNSEAQRDTNLVFQGVIISREGMVMKRLGTDTNRKAETFIYRPDLMLFATATLGYADYFWQEVQP